jgi:hypothetical protein
MILEILTGAAYTLVALFGVLLILAMSGVSKVPFKRGEKILSYVLILSIIIVICDKVIT